MASKERYKASFQGCREKPQGWKELIYYTFDALKIFGSLGIGMDDRAAKPGIS
jgi:hypothetical protein